MTKIFVATANGLYRQQQQPQQYQQQPQQQQLPQHQQFHQQPQQQYESMQNQPMDDFIDPPPPPMRNGNALFSKPQNLYGSNVNE